MYENHLKLSNGEEIFYRMKGQGEPVVLLHGNMSSSVHMISLLEALADNYQVYAPDMRGFGDSSYKSEAKEVISYAQDIREWIEHLGLSGVHIIGWSFGGGVALELAAISSLAQVKDLILIAPIGIKGLGFETMPRLIEDGFWDDSSFIDKAKTLFDSLKGILLSQEEKRKIKAEFLWDQTMFNKKEPDEISYKKYMEATLKQKNNKDIISAIYSFNMTKEKIRGRIGSGRVSKIHQRVCILHGKDDLVVPLQSSKETLRFLSKESKLISIDEGGHFLFFEYFDEVVDHISSFLREK